MAKSRRKAAVATSPAAEPDTSFNPAEFETPREQAAAIVQDVAQSMALPDTEREAAHENGHAARHAPQRENGQSHADAVGKRERNPRYSGNVVSDSAIGAHRTEHLDPYYSIIRFDEKPSDPVITKLKDDGFSWSQPNKEWKRYINFESKEQDREHARRTFTEVCKMIRVERGIPHDFGLPR